MKSVAVLLAKNMSNCGMYSVDLAALHFFQKLNVPYDFFCAFPPATVYGELNINYLQTSGQLDDYDVIVYWGDFTTNPMYGLRDFTFQDQHYRQASSATESWSRWCSLFLPPIRNNNKVYMSVGQNFQAVRSVLDRVPSSELYERYKRFHHIFVRDSYSYSELTDLFPNLIGKVTCGMDCAFLVNSAVVGVEQKPDIFASSFGRSQFINYNKLISELQVYGFKEAMVSGWLKLREYRSHWSYRKKLDIVRSANFALSDTYHFLINTIRENTPVIGFGNKKTSPVNTLSDFKKDVLFKDLGLQDYYFHLEDGSLSDAAVTAIVELVRSPSFDAKWRVKREKISSDISDFEKRLVECFMEILR